MKKLPEKKCSEIGNEVNAHVNSIYKLPPARISSERNNKKNNQNEATERRTYLDAAFGMSRNSFISSLNVEKGSQSHREQPMNQFLNTIEMALCESAGEWNRLEKWESRTRASARAREFTSKIKEFN